MRRFYYTVFVMFWAFGGFSQAQFELGFFGGGANYLGDLVEKRTPNFQETQLAYGLSGTLLLGNEWGIRLGGLMSKISGSDSYFSDQKMAARAFSFETDILEASLVATWEPFGSRRYREDHRFRKIFSPYLFAGLGMTFWDAQPDFSSASREIWFERIQQDRPNGGAQSALSIPIGFGLKRDLGKKAVISAELGFRTAFSDYLDGISHTGNPKKNDWYTIGGLTYAVRFGPKDVDNDGIVDKEDKCPRVPGSYTAGGCPDADGDGVEDLEDVCPDQVGTVEMNGCPDRDGDFVNDVLDKCPDLPGTEKTDGCPDTDLDGIADAEDQCPYFFGSLALNGCPDQDEDGIADWEDLCPEVPGYKDCYGCQFADSDQDGTPDSDDPCPDIEGPLAAHGCPDQDKDGVADEDDKCPELPGLKHNGGCPEISDKAKEVLIFASKAIEFETGSDIIKKSSLKTLEEIANILNEYPYYSLKIAGHTDSRGNDQSNLELSKRRAKSCFDYLSTKGIPIARMSHDGFGESQPIGDNDTPEGRRLNRRVEFDLFIK
ncbi:MAG: DUF6089 family protein [Saprospiraceae bacterium]